MPNARTMSPSRPIPAQTIRRAARISPGATPLSAAANSPLARSAHSDHSAAFVIGTSPTQPLRPGLPTHPETSPIVAHARQAFGSRPLMSLVVIPRQDIIDGGHAINARLSAEQNDVGSSGAVWFGPSANGTHTEYSVILLEPAAMS